MNENEQKVALYHQRKRKKRKIGLAIKASILIIISLILISIYLVLNNKYYINHTENSKVKYTVNLIENEFYDENYFEKDVDVISSLIKDIAVEFKYNLNLTDELEYEYSYKILSEIEVKEKSKTNLIYKSEQELLSSSRNTKKSKNLEILEKINIDYNQYNNQVNKLLDAYKLNNTISELSVNMYVNVINKATGEKINLKDNVMSIKIPLTTKTAEITICENVKNSQGNITIQQNEYKNSEYFLIIGILILVIGLVTLGRLIKYISDTRSAEKMYDDELKKIIFDYKSYIQKTNDKVDYEGYKVINIDTFRELLSMREELQAPILMYTEEQERRTTFMIINTNLLFVHTLAATEIRKTLIEKSKERKKKEESKHVKNK